NNFAAGYTNEYTLAADNSLQSLTRTDFNLAGQTLSVEAYFKFDGMDTNLPTDLLKATINSDSMNSIPGRWESPDMQHGLQSADNYTAGTHYKVPYTYHGYGRQFQTTNPIGTITRTTYDSLDRPYQISVGTAPNSLAIVTTNTYDNNSVGDSNLTSTT